MTPRTLARITSASARFVCDSSDRPRWLKARSRGIGASDAAPILGRYPYKGPLEVYYRLLGELRPEDKVVMRWGHRLEPVIAAVHAEETSRRVERHGLMLASKKHPFLFATPDYLQYDVKRGRRPGLLECKNMSALAAETWSGWKSAPPEWFWIQAQHQLLVTGLEWASVAVFVGGNELRTYDFDVDRRFGQKLVSTLRAFWKRLQARRPPPADGRTSTAAALAQLAEEPGSVVDLPAEAAGWLADIDRLEDERRSLESRLCLAKNQVKAALEHASYGIVPGVADRVFSFKRVETPEHTVHAHGERRLLVVRPPRELRLQTKEAA